MKLKIALKFQPGLFLNLRIFLAKVFFGSQSHCSDSGSSAVRKISLTKTKAILVETLELKIVVCAGTEGEFQIQRGFSSLVHRKHSNFLESFPALCETFNNKVFEEGVFSALS